MSSMSDRPQPTALSSRAHAFGRLASRSVNDEVGDRRAASFAGSPSVETVTLNKIGDFLELDFGRVFAWLRAGFVTAMTLAVIGAAAGGAYATLSKPRYTVSTDILVDPANLQVVSDDLYAQPGQVDGQLLNAGSKLRVLTSGNVLARVVDELDLVNDKEFYDPTPSFSLTGFLHNGSSDAAVDPRIVALGNLEQRVNTKADEKSYVADLFVSAQTPEKAITISNAIVTAFQEELAKGEADGAGRAASALDDRLNELKAAVKAADDKVEAYKRTHNLASADGQLVSTQMMTQLNAQVVDAQSKVIAAQSAYDALRAAGPNATTTDSAESAALTALRDKADGLKQQLDAASMLYGPRHPTIVGLKAQVTAVDSQLDAEISRIVGAAKSALAQANASLVALRSKSSTLTNGVYSDSEAQVGLRELQRDADARTAIYESFLTRARQITEREQIDTTNVRVISTAVPPPDRSWPPRTVVVVGMGAVGGLVFGLLLSVGYGIFRDLRQPLRRRAGYPISA